MNPSAPSIASRQAFIILSDFCFIALYNTKKSEIRQKGDDYYFSTGEQLIPICFNEETNSEVTATWNLVEWNSMLYLVPGS